MKENKSIDEVIEEFSRIPQTPQISEIYQIEDIVKVKINRIVSYGAFATTVDDHKFVGLIHIKNIANQYVDDVNDYFDIDEELNVKIIDFKKEKGVEKAQFSTEHLQLQPKNKEKSHVFDLPFQQKLVSIKEALPPASEDELLDHIEREISLDKEFEDIFHIIARDLGLVSAESKQKLVHLINEYGLVNVTVTLLKTMDTFKKDLTWYFVKEVEKKLDDSL